MENEKCKLCVFFKDENCVIPSEQNLILKTNGDFHCVNYITDIKDVDRDAVKKYKLNEPVSYKKIDGSSFTFPKENSIKLTELIYNSDTDSFNKGQCFNNLYSVITNSQFLSRLKSSDFAEITSENTKICYGCICSGIPHINGIAVTHAWVECGNAVVDVNVPAGNYPIESMLQYIYISREKMSIEHFLAKSSSYGNLPDEQLRSDFDFLSEIESLGYNIIG